MEDHQVYCITIPDLPIHLFSLQVRLAFTKMLIILQWWKHLYIMSCPKIYFFSRDISMDLLFLACIGFCFVGWICIFLFVCLVVVFIGMWSWGDGGRQRLMPKLGLRALFWTYMQHLEIKCQLYLFSWLHLKWSHPNKKDVPRIS